MCVCVFPLVQTPPQQLQEDSFLPPSVVSVTESIPLHNKMQIKLHHLLSRRTSLFLLLGDNISPIIRNLRMVD